MSYSCFLRISWWTHCFVRLPILVWLQRSVGYFYFYMYKVQKWLTRQDSYLQSISKNVCQTGYEMELRILFHLDFQMEFEYSLHSCYGPTKYISCIYFEGKNWQCTFALYFSNGTIFYCINLMWFLVIFKVFFYQFGKKLNVLIFGY